MRDDIDRALDRTRVRPGKHRRVQVARTGGRKLFDGARRRLFLEWFAATCNIGLSAERAGVAYQTVFKHRMKSEAFADAWDRALAQGYARLEARVLASGGPEPRIDIDGDLDPGDEAAFDRDFALRLLREHAARAGVRVKAGEPRKPAQRVRVATDAEVRAALEKRIRAFAARNRRTPVASGEGPETGHDAA